jgi:hypothetical protein
VVGTALKFNVIVLYLIALQITLCNCFTFHLNDSCSLSCRMKRTLHVVAEIFALFFY